MTESIARISALDLIRGVAVLGILAINVASFAAPGSATFSPDLPHPGTAGLWANHAAYLATLVLFEGKMRALFSVLPGSQHSFGTILIEECFRRKGWLTTCLTSATDDQLVRLIADQHFELIGLTVNCDYEVAPATALIARLRAKSKNASLAVMVGGRILAEQPELAQQMGADATAPDAEQALARAEILVRSLDVQAAYRC